VEQTEEDGVVEILRGRWTVPVEAGGVVFLIGMRINRVRSVRSWLPVVLAMPRMLVEAQRDPARGLLSARTFVSGRTVLVRQYWTDVASLQAYALDSRAEHLPAWRAFNARARRAGGAVGIFHETYPVDAGAFETIAVDMPRSGAHEAFGAVPVVSARDRAADRLPA